MAAAWRRHASMAASRDGRRRLTAAPTRNKKGFQVWGDMAERLLIIDDDARLAAMVSDYLTAAGFAVERRFTGREGLAALEGATFDAIILDVMLPDIDGFEVCRTIRARAQTPILMLTARGEEMDRDRRPRDRRRRLSAKALQPARIASAHPRHPAARARQPPRTKTRRCVSAACRSIAPRAWCASTARRRS